MFNQYNKENSQSSNSVTSNFFNFLLKIFSELVDFIKKNLGYTLTILNSITVSLIRNFALVVLVLFLIYSGIKSIPNIRTLFRLLFIPATEAPFDPVARFTVNVDWENRKIKLDGTASKIYENPELKNKKHGDTATRKFIWRINDGSTLPDRATVDHTLPGAGYYQIKLSVVDDKGKSDQATCSILFPAKEVEKIEHNKVQTRNLYNPETGRYEDKPVQNTSYEYRPKEVFFNYSDLLNPNFMDLTSPKVDQNCGVSQVGYNNQTNQDLFTKEQKITIILGNLIEKSFYIGLAILLYLVYKILLHKKYLNFVEKLINF